MRGASGVWVGRILSGVAALFMVFDGILHVARPAPVVQAFNQLGYPLSLAGGLGIVEFVCVVLYVIPRTSILGAILLTGYLGGAVAVQLRVAHSPVEAMFPVLIGLLIWGGSFLREPRLRALIPVRCP